MVVTATKHREGGAEMVDGGGDNCVLCLCIGDRSTLCTAYEERIGQCFCSLSWFIVEWRDASEIGCRGGDNIHCTNNY